MWYALEQHLWVVVCLIGSLGLLWICAIVRVCSERPLRQRAGESSGCEPWGLPGRDD